MQLKRAGGSDSQPQPGTSTDNGNSEAENVPGDIFDFYEKMDREEDDEEDMKVVSFEIDQNHLETLQKRYLHRVKNIGYSVVTIRQKVADIVARC